MKGTKTPSSSPDPLGGTPRTSTQTTVPPSSPLTAAPATARSPMHPMTKTNPTTKTSSHIQNKQIDQVDPHDTTEDSRASPSFDRVRYSSGTSAHQSSQRGSECSYPTLSNTRSPLVSRKQADAAKDSLGFTLSAHQEPLSPFSSSSNSIENARAGPSTTRINPRPTSFPSSAKRVTTSSQSDAPIRPPSRPRKTRIQDVNPVKSARKLVLPVPPKPLPLPSIPLLASLDSNPNSLSSRSQPIQNSQDQQEEDSIEMLRNLGPIRLRETDQSRTSLFKLPGSDTLFGWDSEPPAEEMMEDVMVFMDEREHVDDIDVTTEELGMTKRDRGGEDSLITSANEYDGIDSPRDLVSLPIFQGFTPVNSSPPPDSEHSATSPSSRILDTRPARPLQPDEQDQSINHRTIPSERQFKRRPSVVYRPGRRRSMSVGSRVAKTNVNEGEFESNSDLELPSLEDNEMPTPWTMPRAMNAHARSVSGPVDRPAPVPRPEPQRPRKDNPRLPQRKKRNVIELTPSERAAIDARNQELRAIDAYELEVDYVVWDD